MFFILGCPRMKASGSKPVITVTVSDPGCQGIGDLTETDTGFGPIMAGTGTQTSVSAGQLTTTADGSILVRPDGAGFREINGRRLGVSWRESDEKIGWAPLPPEADVSEHQSISSWSDSAPCIKSDRQLANLSRANDRRWPAEYKPSPTVSSSLVSVVDAEEATELVEDIKDQRPEGYRRTEVQHQYLIGITLKADVVANTISLV